MNNLQDDNKEVLRITSYASWLTWLMCDIDKFMDKYPEAILKISTIENQDLDFSCYDIAVLPLRVVPDDIKVVKLFSINYGLYANKAYLANKGTPKQPEDLKDHIVMSFYDYDYDRHNHDLLDWHLKLTNEPFDFEEGPNTPISCSSVLVMNTMVDNGVGIFSMSDAQVKCASSPDLIRVLPNYQGPVIEVCCYYKKDNKSNVVKYFEEYLWDLKKNKKLLD